MHRQFLNTAALCGLALVGIAMTSTAADKAATTETVITVGEICGGCVKKIEKKLKPMEGVAGVRCDIKARTIMVVPKPKIVLSAKTLWEALAEIGKTPKKLVGPSGTFIEKPKS